MEDNSQLLKFEMVSNGPLRALIIKNCVASDFGKYEAVVGEERVETIFREESAEVRNFLYSFIIFLFRLQLQNQLLLLLLSPKHQKKPLLLRKLLKNLSLPPLPTPLSSKTSLKMSMQRIWLMLKLELGKLLFSKQRNGSIKLFLLLTAEFICLPLKLMPVHRQLSLKNLFMFTLIRTFLPLKFVRYRVS